MCLTSRATVQNKSTIAVMSSGDSNVLSSTPSSSNSPHQTSLSMGKSESSEKFRGDVASLDAVSIESEVGELKKESAQSAFVITSVEPAPAEDDLDTTGGRVQPTSMDDSTLRIKLESGESEEDTVSLSDDVQTPANVPGDVEPSSTFSSAFAGGLSSSSAVDLSRLQQTSASGNGPSVQPGGGRFRKVNKYSRGRWTVRDMETTEERSGTELAARQASQSGSSSRTNISEPNVGSPSLGRRGEQIESLHSRSGSELGQTSMTSMTTVGAPSDNVSDKDSTSIHLDRSSTAADTLSRNTSLSSINAPDDRSTDVDIDAQTTTATTNVGELPEPHSSATTGSYLPPHHAGTLTSSLEVPLMTSTAQVREHPVSQLNGPLESAAESQIPNSENPVKEAMAHLQKQLDALLTSKTDMQQENSKLYDKIKKLTGDNEKLKEDNKRLGEIVDKTAGGQQASQLQERNRILQEENIKLKNELQSLRSALSQLVQKGSDNSIETVPSHGGASHT